MPAKKTTNDTNNSTVKEEAVVKDLEKKLNSYLTKIFGKTTDVEELKQKATTLISDKTEKTKKNMQELHDLVKKHPTASLVIAALAGAGLGSLSTKVKAKKAAKIAVKNKK
ncbi:hypothetical protein JXM83_05800 [Candidatus Woesearchaeota archaeon]|nr:hypothetical protein [Candidatus Woesearchaeota archaeon]